MKGEKRWFAYKSQFDLQFPSSMTFFPKKIIKSSTCSHWKEIPYGFFHIEMNCSHEMMSVIAFFVSNLQEVPVWSASFTFIQIRMLKRARYWISERQ